MMHEPFSIGSLQFPHRLIQGPLAGYSCAPFRALFSYFTPPAYCVSEMLSAYDVVHKHQVKSRLLYRDQREKMLCYQLSGTDPTIMASAAVRLENMGADLIDINCGCPKPKIRKKGAGSALLENPRQLLKIVETVRKQISCPLTVKIRLHQDISLVKQIADAGADALIVHGRHWNQDYDQPCDFSEIAKIKQAVAIPVIANGDMSDAQTLALAMDRTACDGFMISRAGTGKPELFQTLLGEKGEETQPRLLDLYLLHLTALATLEGEHQAVLQSKSLVRYYFKNQIDHVFLQKYYKITSLKDIEAMLMSVL
jgi:tRNA-dihydrouridine synthase B